MLDKAIKGSETSIFVGCSPRVLATLLGTMLGALAGYYGGWVDDFLNWFYSVFTSIPYILLILAFAAVLQPNGTCTIVLILGLTGWTGIYRLIRAEYLKHRRASTCRPPRRSARRNCARMFVPHLAQRQPRGAGAAVDLHVVGFIKAEVILSFLGFGVPVDRCRGARC